MPASVTAVRFGRHLRRVAVALRSRIRPRNAVAGRTAPRPRQRHRSAGLCRCAHHKDRSYPIQVRRAPRKHPVHRGTIGSAAARAAIRMAFASRRNVRCHFRNARFMASRNLCVSFPAREAPESSLHRALHLAIRVDPITGAAISRAAFVIQIAGNFRGIARQRTGQCRRVGTRQSVGQWSRMEQSSQIEIPFFVPAAAAMVSAARMPRRRARSRRTALLRARSCTPALPQRLVFNPPEFGFAAPLEDFRYRGVFGRFSISASRSIKSHPRRSARMRATVVFARPHEGSSSRDTYSGANVSACYPCAFTHEDPAARSSPRLYQ